MTAEKDQAAWLPQAPPPRPARRDAAIQTALRKFEGVEDVAPSVREGPRRSWASTHRPQVAVLVSAMLLVVAGVPAALIGLRNAPPPPTPVVRERAVPVAERPAPPPPPAAKPPMTPLPPTTPRPLSAPPVSKYRGEDLGVVATNEPARQAPKPVTVDQMLPAVPTVAVAPPAPPPPPPPPLPQPAPQAVAQADQVSGEAKAENVVVTASRAPSAALAAPGAMKSMAVDDQGYPKFLSRLQAAVKVNDRRAIIGLMEFPLRVNAASGTRLYRDSASVQRDFDRIFTPKVRNAILRQRGDRLFVRDQGAMVGDGELWFSETCVNAACSPAGPVRIIAVNP